MLSICEECKSHGLEQNRVSPCRGGGNPLGDPLHYPKNWLVPPCSHHCFDLKCRFCNFHVPPPVDPIWETLQSDFNKRNDETEENDGDGSSSSDSDGDDDTACKYYRWKKGDR